MEVTTENKMFTYVFLPLCVLSSLPLKADVDHRAVCAVRLHSLIRQIIRTTQPYSSSCHTTNLQTSSTSITVELCYDMCAAPARQPDVLQLCEAVSEALTRMLLIHVCCLLSVGKTH